jgi:peptidoglycan/LPS O-acetylase OafA/YrhL
MYSKFFEHPQAQTLGHAMASRLGYLPGLDGVRALAILAVLAYHADVGWLPGGFLGVEIFFVVSGYLITSLLMSEYRANHAINLKHFWQRRARRLLPALFVLILAVLAYAVIFLPEEVAGLRADALSAFTYATNWYLIFAQKSYFETVGRPSLLRHLWSLAVEEQFYLLWPPVFVGLLVRLKSWRAILVLMAGAATSALWMGTLFQPDVDPSRVYYGTDTRAAGILLGAALAFVWRPRAAGASTTSVRRWLLDAVGWSALGGLVAACVLITEFDPFLYHGGMCLVAVATTLVIAAVVHPQSPLFGPVMSTGALRWIGVRSYSLYLWHWPVFMVTRPQLDVTIDGATLLALRMGVTFVLAELSYRFVETPMRHGALGKAWTAWQQAQGMRRWGVRLAGMGVVTPLVIAVLLLGSAVMQAQPPQEPVYVSTTAEDDTISFETHDIHAQALEVPDTLGTEASVWSVGEQQYGQRHLGDAAKPGNVADVLNDAAKCQTEPTSDHLPEGSVYAVVPPTGDAVPTAAAASAAWPLHTQSAQVLAIGDSVMLGASHELRKAVMDVEVDAQVGRQVSAALQLLRERKAARRLAPVVIIHLGNNGTFSAKQFDDIMVLLQDVPRVVFLTDKVPRKWQDPNNNALTNGVPRYPNASLVEWHARSVGHPDWFGNDGIHLRPEGAKIYANLIATTLR